MSDDSSERHSDAIIPDLIVDENAKAEREATNGLRQFDSAVQTIDTFLEPERRFKLRPSLVLTLHRIALEGISPYAGAWRPGDVKIGQSKHTPPPAHLVPELIEEMCDYVNEHWLDLNAVELSAYSMWRLNWIHPFTDGNGRTARALAYVLLCLRLECRLPGRRTVPEQISENKKPYYDALEAADLAQKEGQTNIGQLAQYLGDLLANQLLTIHEDATGERSDRVNT